MLEYVVLVVLSVLASGLFATFLILRELKEVWESIKVLASATRALAEAGGRHNDAIRALAAILDSEQRRN